VPNTWGYRRVQEYKGHEDGVDQVKTGDDGIVALGRGWTHIYMGDVDGIDQVKEEGEVSSLAEEGHPLTSGFGGFVLKTIRGVWWFRPQNNRRTVWMVSRVCPQNQTWTVWWVEPQNHILDGFTGLSSEPGQRFRGGTERHVVES
jgi:hypothetical protein